MRGTLRSPRDRNANKRFIPARAGNSSIVRGSRTGRSVHPRACGELLLIISRVFHQNGSSPRVRGTPGDPDYECGLVRFIPARAGNSCSRQHRSSRHTVHPRACGELTPSGAPLPIPTGSSPRVRGTHLSLRADRVGERFIPARAGNSPGTGSDASSGVGSSPRVRGTQRLQLLRVRLYRFIPARAGNSTRPRPVEPMLTVHPRACGELNLRFEINESVLGSSPRVRGTPTTSPR